MPRPAGTGNDKGAIQMTITETDYWKTCTAEAELGLLELANHIARKRQILPTVPADVDLGTTRGWIIWGQIMTEGMRGKESWDYRDYAVLGQDGHLYKRSYNRTVYSYNRADTVDIDYCRMTSKDYEMCDVRYKSYSFDQETNWRRSSEYYYPHTEGLRKALEAFDKKDHEKLIEQPRREKAEAEARARAVKQQRDRERNAKVIRTLIKYAAIALLIYLGIYLIVTEVWPWLLEELKSWGDAWN